MDCRCILLCASAHPRNGETVMQHEKLSKVVGSQWSRDVTVLELRSEGIQECFEIKKGEIIGSVQGAMVSGNVMHLLSSLEAIGNDHADFGCSIMPSKAFRDVKITTG